MKMTVTIDDKLFKTAEQLTEISEKSALVEEALNTLIRQKKHIQRIEELGGSNPNAQFIERRKSG